MRITFLVLWANPNGVYHPGDVRDVPDLRAQELIKNKVAVEFAEEAKAEAPKPPDVHHAEVPQDHDSVKASIDVQHEVADAAPEIIKRKK